MTIEIFEGLEGPDFEALENAIIAQLKTLIDHCPIEPSPNVPATIDELLSRVQDDQIIVAFNGSSLGDFPLLDYVPSGQEETPGFEVDLFCRDLRSHQGAYALIRKVRKALNGFELVTDCFLRLVSIRFLGLNESVWMFGLNFEITLSED
jgi:hypothetical protein